MLPVNQSLVDFLGIYMFVDWILPRHVMNVGQDIRLTRHDTTTDMSDGRCFLETHCILWERQQTTQVVGGCRDSV